MKYGDSREEEASDISGCPKGGVAEQEAWVPGARRALASEMACLVLHTHQCHI